MTNSKFDFNALTQQILAKITIYVAISKVIIHKFAFIFGIFVFLFVTIQSFYFANTPYFEWAYNLIPQSSHRNSIYKAVVLFILATLGAAIVVVSLSKIVGKFKSTKKVLDKLIIEVNDSKKDMFEVKENIEGEIFRADFYVSRRSVNKAISDFISKKTTIQDQIPTKLILGESGVGKSTLVFVLSQKAKEIFHSADKKRPDPIFLAIHYSELQEHSLGKVLERLRIKEILTLLLDIYYTIDNLSLEGRIVILIDSIDKHSKINSVVDQIRHAKANLEYLLPDRIRKDKDKEKVLRCFRFIITCTERAYQSNPNIKLELLDTFTLKRLNSTEIEQVMRDARVEQIIRNYPSEARPALKRVIRLPIFLKVLRRYGAEEASASQLIPLPSTSHLLSPPASIIMGEFFYQEMDVHSNDNPHLENFARAIFTNQNSKDTSRNAYALDQSDALDSATIDKIRDIEKNVKSPRLLLGLNGSNAPMAFQEDVYYQYFLSRWFLSKKERLDNLLDELTTENLNLMSAVRLFFPITNQKDIIHATLENQAENRFADDLAGHLIADMIISQIAKSSPEDLGKKLDDDVSKESKKKYIDEIEKIFSDFDDLQLKINLREKSAFNISLKCADYLFSAGCYVGMRFWLEYVELLADMGQIPLQPTQKFLLNNNLIVLYKNNDQWEKSNDRNEDNKKLLESLPNPLPMKAEASLFINSASVKYDVAEKGNREEATLKCLEAYKVTDVFIKAVAGINLAIFLLYFDRPYLALDFIKKGIDEIGKANKKWEGRKGLVSAYLKLNYVQISLYIYEINSNHNINEIETCLEESKQVFEDSDFEQGIIYVMASEGLYYLDQALKDPKNRQHHREAFNHNLKALRRAQAESFNEKWPQCGCLANLAILFAMEGEKPKKSTNAQPREMISFALVSEEWMRDSEEHFLEKDPQENLKTGHEIVMCALNLIREKNRKYQRRGTREEENGVWHIDPTEVKDGEKELEDGSPDPEGEGILVMIQAYIEIKQGKIQPGTCGTLRNVAAKMKSLGFRWAELKAWCLLRKAHSINGEAECSASSAEDTTVNINELIRLLTTADERQLTTVDEPKVEWAGDLGNELCDEDAKLYENFFSNPKKLFAKADEEKLLSPINWKFLFLREWMLFKFEDSTTPPHSSQADIE